MTKEKRTATQLSDMILCGIGAPNISVEVRRDQAYGWQPTVYTSINALGFQRRAEELAQTLRYQYDLQD